MNAKSVDSPAIGNSHILSQDFLYFEPQSIEDTIAILGEFKGRASIIAGGTSLLVQMKMGNHSTESMVNIGKVPNLDQILTQDEKLVVGARATIRACWRSTPIQKEYTALADACYAFGSTQIQMLGTLGGNICNGSPASDTVPALIVFNAELSISGPRGQRIVPVEEFLLGPGQTNLKSEELVTSIYLAPQQPNTGSAFLKISRVKADLAKVSAAAVITREGDRIVDCRIALGSVAPTVIRAKQAEELLLGQVFNSELAFRVGEVAASEISPVDDVRSTAWYRRRVTGAIIQDVLSAAWERSGTNQKKFFPNSKISKADTDQRQETYINSEGGELCTIVVNINDKPLQLLVKPNELLINVIRERLLLTGTKYGCGIGECGACTVQVNGEPALSCLTLAVSVDGNNIRTIEGIQQVDGDLDPLQEAFVEKKGFQCGYCTPGMIMMAKSIFTEYASPTEDDIRDYLRGNRCRCTGYISILRSVMSYVEDHQHE